MSEPIMDWQKIFATLIVAAILAIASKTISTPTKGDVKEMIESSLSSRPLPSMLSRSDITEMIRDKAPDRQKTESNTYHIEWLKEYVSTLRKEDDDLYRFVSEHVATLKKEDENLYRLVSELNSHMSTINIKVEKILVMMEEMRVKKKPVQSRTIPEQQRYWEWEMLPTTPPAGKAE